MSDEGLGDDLFPESPVASPAAPKTDAQPVASGSRSPSPKAASASGSPAPASPAQNGGGDDEDLDDLFGGEDEDDEPKEAEDGDEDRRRDSSATPEQAANPLEYEEEEGDGVQVEQYFNNLMLPKLPRMNATDGKVWHLKLPAYVNIDSTPYDADYYHAVTEDEEQIDGKAEPMLAKQKILGVKNTIRWRWASGLDGQQTPQANARMVRWSDGSMSLQLGSDLFDVASSHGTTLARPEDLEKAGKPPLPADHDPLARSTTFLCTPSTYERVLLTETAIAGQLSLVPTSGTSKTHIELVKHVGQQHVKRSRLVLIDQKDPEHVALLAKANGKDLSKPAKPRAKRNSSGGGAGRRKATRRFLNDYSDEDGDLPPRRSGRGDYDDDDEDGFIVADDSDAEEEEAAETEDEDEMAYGSSRKSKSKSKSKSRKRKGSDDEDDDLDSMEEADRRIEQREREKKRAKREKKKKSRDHFDTDEDEDEDPAPAPTKASDGEEEMDMDMDDEPESE